MAPRRDANDDGPPSVENEDGARGQRESVALAVDTLGQLWRPSRRSSDASGLGVSSTAGACGRAEAARVRVG